jgi:undecaprenyl diphosphate synthase
VAIDGRQRPAVDPARIPAHVAIIMDGNGRWANQRGLKRNAGHEAGEAALFDTVEGALELGIGNLTVYAFSTENWRRPAEEVRFLLGFNESLLVRRAGELDDRGVRVRFIGRRDRRVPKRLIRLIEDTEALTAANTRMTLRIAFNYGGQVELVDAARRAAEDLAAGRLRRIDERSFAARLYDPEMPEVDLLVRTSGEQRISNFLLWQAAYAELVFVGTLWPDFDRVELARAVATYQARDRRFGTAVDHIELDAVDPVDPPPTEEAPVARFVVKPSQGTLFGSPQGWAVVDTGDDGREVNRYRDRAAADARAADLNAGPLDLDAQEAWLPEEDDEPWGEDDHWHDSDRDRAG